MQLPHLHQRLRAVIGLHSALRAYPPSYAWWGSCSSAQGFASSFFQPTPRDAHLAFGYEVATAGPSRDFHPL